MSTKNSSIIADKEASPQRFSEGVLESGQPYEASDIFEVEAGDLANGDIINLCDLPANAIVRGIEIVNDALDSGAGMEFDVGLYDLDGNTKDVDVYVDGSSEFQTANAVWTTLTEARGQENLNQRVYEDAGDDFEDRGPMYRVAATITAAAGGSAQAGTVGFRVHYAFKG